jgi:hypothetical protein
MSLALAAVGVGAWTYDTVRRYRAAMDMVSHQEQSVLARFSPRADQSSAPMQENLSGESDGSLNGSESVKDDASPTIERDGEASFDLDDADGDVQGAAESEPLPTVLPETVSADIPSEEPSDQLSERPGPDGGQESLDLVQADDHVESEDAGDSSSAPTSKTIGKPETEVAGKWDMNPAEPTETGKDVSAARWPILNRSSDKTQDAQPVKAEFSTLPPLPEEASDTLIEEAVRFDMNPGSDRTIPSWLFEDLEADLSQAGSFQKEDPIDQFRDSKPKQRGSALDRILAGNDGSRPAQPGGENVGTKNTLGDAPRTDEDDESD